ncbi:MAG TPA: hypothetical protein VK192_08145 [Sphingomicrobium sp.]|jgi:hypothetical protein|nr:hypothetical protein [Sphingomicrobium sp.]
MSLQYAWGNEHLATWKLVGSLWLGGGALIAAAAFTSSQSARAVPAFAQQTGQACKSCHVGGFGPELTPFGREFKLGGYTLRAHASVPLAAMAISSFTHTRKAQKPAPEHLSRNNNLTLDEAAIFVAGGVGDHLGGFAEITYEGIDRHFTWDNLDLRAITTGKMFGEDATFGLSVNNNPGVQDVWNTLPAWGFPFTDTEATPTPDAAPLIDDALAQNVLGITAYGWIGHKFYLEAGGYSTPSAGTLRWLGSDPTDPGKIHGIAPYARGAYQTTVAGGTFELGASFLNAKVFPGRDRSSGFTDRYTDWGLDSSWQKTIGRSDLVSANIRYEHEFGDLRASCALGLIGDGNDVACARYHLNEWRGAVRYTLHDKVGFTLSPFSITGSQNHNVFDGSGRPDSNGVMGQVDYTFWPNGNSPLGPLANARVGVQYTIYGKFNGRRHNFDQAGTNASDNDVLRVFTWVAF